MKVLFVCPWLPWPLNAGGKIRTFNLIRAASASSEIHLRAVLEPDQDARMVDELRPYCASVRVFPRTRPGPVMRWSRTKLERWFHSPALRAAVAEDLRGGFDLVHLDELLLARVPGAPNGTPVVQHHHKLDTVLYEITTARDGMQRHFDLWKLRRLESESARRFQHHLLCSEGDAAILTQRHPRVRCGVLPSGYDPGYFHPTDPRPTRESDLLLFLGSMDYEPNVEAVLRFARETLPRIRRRRPGVRLEVVGRAPSPEVRALREPGVAITGEVPDVRPYLERAALMVVPLRIGGGTRLKIVEALGMACPVLSTRVGAEGLGLEDGRELALAEGEEGFARRALVLLEDPARAQRLGHAGRRAVLERYDWKVLGGRLVDYWQGVVAAERGTMQAV